MGSIILFDGVCNLCNSSVNFIIDRDPKEIFKFTNLQSNKGKLILDEYQLLSGKMESIVLIEGDKVYTKSTAALRIAKRLTYPWPSLYVFILFPRPIRDFIYNIIAKNRYRWFGRTDQCRIPSAQLQERFI